MRRRFALAPGDPGLSLSSLLTRCVLQLKRFRGRTTSPSPPCAGSGGAGTAQPPEQSRSAEEDMLQAWNLARDGRSTRNSLQFPTVEPEQNLRNAMRLPPFRHISPICISRGGRCANDGKRSAHRVCACSVNSDESVPLRTLASGTVVLEVSRTDAWSQIESGFSAWQAGWVC